MPQRIVRKVNGRALLAALIGALVAWFGIIGYVLYDQGRRSDKNATALKALCAQRHDLDLRIATTQALLDKYPHPKTFRREVGIPRKLIVGSQRQSEQTRKNLEILNCR
jgi:hypothetical protein